MKTIAKIIDIEEPFKTPKGTELCNVSVKSGDTLMTVTMFGNSIKDGTLDKLRNVLGQEVLTEINPSLYNGNLSYNFGYNAEFKPVNPSQLKKAS